MKKPAALRAGDTIGIAAPSSPFDKTKFLKGIHALESLGFKTFYRKDIFDQNRYLAGTDERRAQEFTELITNKSVSAIMFARGGYGSQRVIPLLKKEVLSSHPKPVIGFSDITPLLAFLRQSCNIPTFYGPVITQLGAAKDEESGRSLFSALTSPTLENIPMGKTKILKPGEAEGPLVGGCLSLINSSMGTSYELGTDGAILFIEEVNEKVYVLDRMLTQLKNSGKLGNARGIIFGSIIPPDDEPHDIEPMIRDVLNGFEGPVLTDFPAGHGESFITLPLGVTVKIEAAEATPKITFTTSIFS